MAQSKARKAQGTLPVGMLLPPTYAEIQVNYLKQARTFRREPKIHARRIIPQVPEGEESHDAAPTETMALRKPVSAPRAGRARAKAAAPSEEIVLVRNTELDSAADNNTASNVCEPSVAVNGEVVLFTGNWFAAVSTDGGARFRYVDPYTAFPDPPGMGFCCDQVAHYIRSIDTFVWLLQYTEDASGENIQRLAFARTADVAAGRWRTFDIYSRGLGLPGVFLDYPDLATSNKMLYVTMNGFQGNDWTATVIVRFPTAGIRAGNITAQHAISRDNFNFRVAQHCTTRAYWASHQTTSTLRVFSWAETEASPVFQDVTVARWTAGDYQSLLPDGENWLGRADPRLTGATKAGAYLWFAWGANRGGVNQRPNPYVQIARISAASLTLKENINLWDQDSATCYPALSTSARGEVGVSYAIGGGRRFPSHVVGVLSGTRREVLAVLGARSPRDQQWGDYLTVRRNYPNTKLFAATGYTLRGPGGVGADASPHFVVFGRQRNV